MQPTGSIGTLTGGGGPGIDRLELQDRGTSFDVLVSATGRSVLGVVGTFSGIEQAESLGTNTDRLLGGIANTSWSINGLGQVVVGAVTYTGFEEIAAGSGIDTLTGPALETTWNIAGSNTGQVSALVLNYAFSGMENLTGGAAPDTREV